MTNQRDCVGENRNEHGQHHGDLHTRGAQPSHCIGHPPAHRKEHPKKRQKCQGQNHDGGE
jgi:hypothetical protein